MDRGGNDPLFSAECAARKPARYFPRRAFSLHRGIPARSVRNLQANETRRNTRRVISKKEMRRKRRKRRKEKEKEERKGRNREVPRDELARFASQRTFEGVGRSEEVHIHLHSARFRSLFPFRYSPLSPPLYPNPSSQRSRYTLDTADAIPRQIVAITQLLRILDNASGILGQEWPACDPYREPRASISRDAARFSNASRARRESQRLEEGRYTAREGVGFRGFSANVSGKPAEHVHQRFQSDSALGRGPSASLALGADFARAMQ